jgi:SagB-type dehydrogenase family enzyme
MDMSVGESFQEKTKHRREAMAGKELDWNKKPPVYKIYPDAVIIELPSPMNSSMPLPEVLRGRRSVRRFTEEPLSLERLSFLLWACAGIRETRGGHNFRTAPSAGALYPIETYLAVNSVDGLQPGLYHYRIRDHALELLREGVMGEEIAHAALEQEMCAQAPVAFIWTAMFERSKWKYGQRAYRYVYLDAGHIGGNLAMAAVSIGLGSCQIAAAFDDEVNKLIGIDGAEESVLYMSVVGSPVKGR